MPGNDELRFVAPAVKRLKVEEKWHPKHDGGRVSH